MTELNIYALWMIVVFVIGYAAITLEHIIKINKATVALMMAIISWVLVFLFYPCSHEENIECFLGNLAEISQIVFFLIGALAIVEIISIHQGFRVISDFIHVSSKKKLLWVMGIVTFFLSSVLDNLTTTIVMVTLLRKLIPKTEDRLIMGGAVVIAANAGGAWTPIGDVTTTMLWIGGQLSTQRMIPALFLPSMVCLVVSLFILSFLLKGDFQLREVEERPVQFNEKLVFFLGLGSLIFVPIFKLLTGLPPLMGILLGLSVLWIVTDWMYRYHEDKESLKVPTALSRIDLSSTLFFLGILLTVAAMGRAGILHNLSIWLDSAIGNTSVIATLIGLASAVIDNVPLVAAAMEMYALSVHPMDSQLWEMIAFCAGTGGSILIIGSAAGVVYMGLENVDFFWYLRKISLAALLGYFAGIGVYLIL